MRVLGIEDGKSRATQVDKMNSAQIQEQLQECRWVFILETASGKAVTCAFRSTVDARTYAREQISLGSTNEYPVHVPFRKEPRRYPGDMKAFAENRLAQVHGFERSAEAE